MKKKCDHTSSPFWCDKQSHVTEVVNVWCQNQNCQNCHVCLCHLPVLVVTARIRNWWLCIIFTLLVHPLMTGLSIFQIDPSTFYFKFWLGSVCKICWHNWKEHLNYQVWKWYHVVRKFCKFCDFSSNLSKYGLANLPQTCFPQKFTPE